MSLVAEDLIDKIYESAFFPRKWSAVLSGVCNIVNAWGGAIVAVDHHQQTQYITTETYARSYDEFCRSGMAYNNRRTSRHLSSGPAGFLLDLDTCTQAELDTDPIYESFLYPYGIGWTVGTPVPVPTSEMIVFDFCRRVRDGPFERNVVGLLDSLRPHLARSSLIAARLGLARADARVATLEMLGLPGAVLTGDSRVVAANSLLHSLYPAIQIGAFDKLSIASSGANCLLRDALFQLTDQSSTNSIPIPASDAFPALIVHVVPLRRAARDLFIGATCVLVVTPVLMPSAPLRALLTGLFDLTPAEARVAAALVSGKTVREIGAIAGVADDTIHKQLKAIFLKTGVSRQIDLVRLLTSTRSPL